MGGIFLDCTEQTRQACPDQALLRSSSVDSSGSSVHHSGASSRSGVNGSAASRSGSVHSDGSSVSGHASSGGSGRSGSVHDSSGSSDDFFSLLAASGQGNSSQEGNHQERLFHAYPQSDD